MNNSSKNFRKSFKYAQFNDIRVVNDNKDNTKHENITIRQPLSLNTEKLIQKCNDQYFTYVKRLSNSYRKFPLETETCTKSKVVTNYNHDNFHDDKNRKIFLNKSKSFENTQRQKMFIKECDIEILSNKKISLISNMFENNDIVNSFMQLNLEKNQNDSSECKTNLNTKLLDHPINIIIKEKFKRKENTERDDTLDVKKLPKVTNLMSYNNNQKILRYNLHRSINRLSITRKHKIDASRVIYRENFLSIGRLACQASPLRKNQKDCFVVNPIILSPNSLKIKKVKSIPNRFSQ